MLHGRKVGAAIACCCPFVDGRVWGTPCMNFLLLSSSQSPVCLPCIQVKLIRDAFRTALGEEEAQFIDVNTIDGCVEIGGVCLKCGWSSKSTLGTSRGRGGDVSMGRSGKVALRQAIMTSPTWGWTTWMKRKIHFSTPHKEMIRCFRHIVVPL